MEFKEIKITDLYKLNELKEMSGYLVNRSFEKEFYDYYMFEPISWLLENEEKIRKDFDKVYDTKVFDFDLLINSKNLRDYKYKAFVRMLKEENLNLLANCYNLCVKNSDDRKKVEKMMKEFKSQDTYTAFCKFRHTQVRN